ncbi:MAG: flavin reductase family protein [Pseudomonadota bacterium]
MFYEPKNGHGLPHNPFSAVITPRPIAWVATRASDGTENLSPYSFFNGVSYTPPQIMFASTMGKPDRTWGKDSVSNIRDTGVFCVNVVEYAMRDAMNTTSGAYGKEVDEFELAGIARRDCEMIDCSRIENAPASLECKLVSSVELPGENNIVVFGEVIGVHLREDCIVGGRFDITRYEPLARLGYQDYTRVSEMFAMARPSSKPRQTTQ